MNERMRQLLPNDRMKIYQSEPFFEDTDTVLTLLYQPLISIKGVAVFQALWKESSYQKTQTSISHHQMMNMLNITLDEFFEARKKLEAIGLLHTYKEEGTYRTLYYILQKPFSVKGFFEDPMLSVLLEHHIGRDAYYRIRKRLMYSMSLPSNVKSVTHAFDDVFTMIHPNEAKQEPVQVEEKTLTIDTNLPLEWLHKMLTQQNIKAKWILTQSNIDFIEKMTKIYDVDFLELEKALLWAVTEDQVLDRKEFQDMCKDIFYKKHGSVPPRLYVKGEQNQTQPEQNTSSHQQEQPQSKEEKLIQHFETITHRELLEDLSSSGRASMKEIDMLTNMMEEHGLSQPVMNVLVDYVLKRNHNKLAKNYLETIAAHWSREGIATAKEAMQIAKREHHMYETWKKKKSYNQKKKQGSNEVLPKWFEEERKNKQKQPSATKQPNQEDLEKEKKELEAFFKNYSKSNH
ncbi:replication initiation and membrane attachment family protein [Tenuibacillus multivorans]|uniref:Replicative DNA helicase loader DnaB n=1 Tax=Tenuibacillus multivorans TaxID=237069 RepID=A0A1G9ZT84_9BACI|nr:DnaD domain protein [Tenuibacillus multivorans]GEL76831.1 replication initiation and membrane attachment protein [Tenuibacillus multivorans]SDN24151.1 replicative DNA helicase loader DnaB [Tenuibacillus multivorans]